MNCTQKCVYWDYADKWHKSLGQTVQLFVVIFQIWGHICIWRPMLLRQPFFKGYSNSSALAITKMKRFANDFSIFPVLSQTPLSHFILLTVEQIHQKLKRGTKFTKISPNSTKKHGRTFSLTDDGYCSHVHTHQRSPPAKQQVSIIS